MAKSSKNTYTYSADGGYGYGATSGDFSASSDDAAKKEVFRRLAVYWTKAKSYKDMDARIERVRNTVTGYYLRLTNKATGKEYEWGASGGWRSREDIEAEMEAEQQRRAEDKKRGYREVEGLILPPDGMELYPVVDAYGKAPGGSSGFAHYGGSEGGVIRISDAATTGRFWPAVWDKDRQRWEVTGEGVQLEKGEVVERLPVKEPLAQQKTPVGEAKYELGSQPAADVELGGYYVFTPPKSAWGGLYGREAWYGVKQLREFNDSMVDGQVVKINPKSIVVKNVTEGEWNYGREYKVPKDALATADLTDLMREKVKAFKPVEIAKKRTGPAIAPGPSGEAKAPSKQPWQMTRGEFVHTEKAEMRRQSGFQKYTNTLKRHRRIVEMAIRERKPVPPEVLKDYPDLQAAKPLFPKPKNPITLRKDPVQRVKNGTWQIEIVGDIHDLSNARLKSYQSLAGSSISPTTHLQGDLVELLFFFDTRTAAEGAIARLRSHPDFTRPTGASEERREKALSGLEAALSPLQSVESSRSTLSKSSDERQEHSLIIEPDDPRTKRWRRDPGSMDVRGVDTPTGKPHRTPRKARGGKRGRAGSREKTPPQVGGLRG